MARWLHDNWRRPGRPDSVPRGRALWTVAADLIRTRNYDCFDRHDMRPALAELRYTATSILSARTPQAPATDLSRKEH